MQLDIIRAWKDADYWAELGANEQAALPQHPAGLLELSEDELGRASGANQIPPDGGTSHTVTSFVPQICTIWCSMFCYPTESNICNR